MGWMWILVTGLGAIALFIAIYYARGRNKQDTPRSIAKAEQGARQVRDEINLDEQQRGE